MPTLYTPAPTIGIIDQNYNLTISWTPVADPITGLYTEYDFWAITTQVNANIQTVNVFAPLSYAGGSQTFTETLTTGTVTLTMQAFSGLSAFLTNPWETNGLAIARVFPDAVLAGSVAFSATSVLLGQPLTISLNAEYVNADQWQVVWPDGTSTSWLPLASKVITKQFSTPGAANVIVQTRYNYSSNIYTPPVTLMRQFTQQIYVLNQEAPNIAVTQGGLAGDLGIGGKQGFEIVNVTTGVLPNPWEAIARAFVRDTMTNELKLLITSTRFSNASSLFGTMALDVFPVQGRPHGKELILPPYELTTTTLTETVPVKISTSTLPNLIVGKSASSVLGGAFTMTAQNGITPFIWSSNGLPSGVTMNSSGVINGTPLELGLFSVMFAVQDSSVPFSIDEITLPLLIGTDLEVEIAVAQTDANDTILSPTGTTLGFAQVANSYSVQMQVGNTNPNATISGGLAPYTWSIPAGALPIGLSIDPMSGLISGVPSTYNSTSDYGLIYTATVQVEDAIGAQATQTYTMQLEAAPLQFGNISQSAGLSVEPRVFSSQQFKLAVPVFGGQSPYTLSTYLLNPSDTSYYSVPVLVDGRIEMEVNFPTTATGVHSFSLTVQDSSSPQKTTTTQFSFIVENEISDARIVPGFLDHVWSYGDVTKATPLPVSGNLAGFILGGLNLSLTSVAASVGGLTTYTGTITNGAASIYVSPTPYTFAVSGFQSPENNGTFTCIASTATTLTLDNPNGVAESLPTFVLTQVANASGNTLASPVAPFTVSTIYTGTITGGDDNAYAGQPFVVTGFDNATNNGTFYCTDSSETKLTLSNPAGVEETDIGSATITTAKALQATTLSNGITVAIDPLIPEVEFTGPPSGPSGVYGNSEYRVPLALQQSGSTVAIISRAFTVLAENNQSPPWVAGDIGAIATTLRPMIVGELVGLNPRKPYFNSPNTSALNSLWTARVQNGSSLPPGLSLDANDGLIYGMLAGTFSAPSVIQYIDSIGVVHGQVTITWNTLLGNFSLIDNISDTQQIGTTQTGTAMYFTVPTGITPLSASVAYGVLPAGLVVGAPVGQNIPLTGTPTEAGYFDVWFQVTSTNQQTAYLYHRIVLEYVKALVILNSSLPPIGAAPYSVTLQGFGGIPPYFDIYPGPYVAGWRSPQFGNTLVYIGGPTAAGTGPFAGLTLVGNSNGTATISGSLTTSPYNNSTNENAPVFDILGPVVITLADTRGAASAVTDTFDLVYDNRLRITTPVVAIIPADGSDYAFQMQAAGGEPPYTWELTVPGSPTAALPDGVFATGWQGVFGTLPPPPIPGLFSGATTDTPYSSSFGITVQDNNGFQSTSVVTPSSVWPFYTLVPQSAFLIQTGIPILTMDDSGMGTIPRGEGYQGTLQVVGPYTTPITWQVAPTPLYPNLILAPLSLQVNGTGANATVLGTYSGVPHVLGTYSISNVSQTGTTVTIMANPNQLQVGDTVVVETASHPAVNGTFQVIFVDQTFPTPNTYFEYTVPASATITSVAESGSVVGQGYIARIIAVDAVGNTAAALVPFLTGTNLNITGWDALPLDGNTNSFPLPNAIVNGSYGPNAVGVQLLATNGVPPYTWNSAPSMMPSYDGLALGSNTGQITGTDNILFTPNPTSFTFTVTDSIFNTFTTVPVPFSSQASTLAFTTTSIPPVTSGRPYSFQLAAAGSAFLPLGFTVSPLSANPLPTGLTLSNSGLISGSTTLTGFSKPVTLRVTDSSGAYVDATFTISVFAGLVLQTGIDYTNGLASPGLSTTTTGVVATGDQIAAVVSNTGMIIGQQLSIDSGANQETVTVIRLVNPHSAGLGHPIATYVTGFEAIFAKTHASGVAVVGNPIAGLGILGYIVAGSVSAINPRPNLSFYVVALGVITTSPSQLLVTVGLAGVTATVQSITNGIALIQLTGTAFAAGALGGDNNISVTVVDSGVTVSASFTWVVYQDHALFLSGSGTLPVQLTAPGASTTEIYIPLLEGVVGNLYINNQPTVSPWYYPTYNGQPVSLPAAAEAGGAVSITGDNTAWQGLVTNTTDGGANMVLNYNGGPMVPLTDQTQLTITAQDVAWYDATSTGFDLFQLIGSPSIGGVQMSIPINWYVKPTPFVASVTPATVPANGGVQTFIVTLTKPISPEQQGSSEWETPNTFNWGATMSGGAGIISINPIYSIIKGLFAGDWLIGFTILAKMPESTVNGSITLSMSINGDVNYLGAAPNGTGIATQGVTYVGGSTWGSYAPVAVIATTGSGYVAPTNYSFTVSPASTTIPKGTGIITLTATIFSVDNGTINMNGFYYKQGSTDNLLLYGASGGGAVHVSGPTLMANNSGYLTTWTITVAIGTVSISGSFYLGYWVTDALSGLQLLYTSSTAYTLS